MNRRTNSVIESLESRICMSISFAQPAVHNAVGGAVRVASGDVTGDGKADLIAQGSDGKVRLFAGLGNGHFETTALRELPTFGPATGIALADFNHDGKLDVAFSTGPTMLTVQAGVTVLLGHGDGTFGVPLVTYGGADTRALAVGDFNRDGKLDVVTANFGAWRTSNTDPLGYGAGVLIGRGDGTFQMVRKVALNGSQTLVTVPRPQPSATNVLPPRPTFDFALGGPVVTDVTPRARIWTVKLAPSAANSDAVDVDAAPAVNGFYPFLGAIHGLDAGDLNHDGRLDLAALQVWHAPNAPADLPDSTAWTFMLRNDGTWGAKSTVNAGVNGGVGLSLADLDRDGKLDVVVAGADPRPTASPVAVGLLAAFPGDGTGAIGQPLHFRTLGTPTAQTLADLNRDGRPDVLVASAAGVDALVNTSPRFSITASDGSDAERVTLIELA